jgi:ribonuclease HII
MALLHERDGRYGYERHKGYATPEHLAALERYGYSPQHRRSFRPASLFDKIPSDGERRRDD